MWIWPSFLDLHFGLSYCTVLVNPMSAVNQTLFMLCTENLPALITHDHWQEVKTPWQVKRHLGTFWMTKLIILTCFCKFYYLVWIILTQKTQSKLKLFSIEDVLYKNSATEQEQFKETTESPILSRYSCPWWHFILSLSNTKLILSIQPTLDSLIYPQHAHPFIHPSTFRLLLLL